MSNNRKGTRLVTTFFQNAHKQDANRDVPLLAKDQYLRELRWMSLADREEQAQLVELIKQGFVERSQPVPDEGRLHQAQQARSRLVEAYQPVIVRLARGFARCSTSYDEMDFANEGSIGLMTLLDKLDAYGALAGASFHVMALAYIRGAMIAALRDRNGIVRLSKPTYALLKQLEQVEQDLFQAFGREPTYHDVAQAMGLPFAKVVELHEYRRRRLVESLEGLLVEGDAEECLNFVSVFEGQADETCHTEIREALHVAIATVLTTKQRNVVQLRYGFDEGPCKLRSHNDVAAILGLGFTSVYETDRRAKGRLGQVLASVVARPVVSVAVASESELSA